MKDSNSSPILENLGSPTVYQAGQTIFTRGEPGNCMYILVKGTIDIKIEGRVVDQLGAGDVFGEMAMIDAQSRSADAVARSDSEVACIDEKQFLSLTTERPEFALEVMRLIVTRLRSRMADLEEARLYLGMLQG